MDGYIVYVKMDAQRCVIDVSSSAFLTDIEGWTEIDQGNGIRYMHAQRHYFDKPIVDERGIKRYRAVPAGDVPDRVAIVEYVKDGVTNAIYERTQEEMDADYAARPAPPPSDKERIAALEAQLASYEAAYAEGVNEA